jgi:hypothetical protein
LGLEVQEQPAELFALVVVAKLGVSSRTQLAAQAARRQAR